MNLTGVSNGIFLTLSHHSHQGVFHGAQKRNNVLDTTMLHGSDSFGNGEAAMPLEIRSTLIREDEKGNTTVELTISDNEILDHAAEQIFLRVLVKVDHPYFPGLQSDAIKRAIAILSSASDALPQFYK